MGKRHASALAGIARATADEELREAETRRQSSERERQLLTSYLGSEDQVAGRGQFNVSPEVLKYTRRYAVDARALQEIQTAGGSVKGQLDPFQSADNALRGGQDVQSYGQGFATKANDLLAQAEAAARSGDTATAERLFTQAQAIIGGVSAPAQPAFNLADSPESAAAIRASSAEGRIVGRQLLTAQQLGDPNSATSTQLRGRLLDPSLTVIDENTRNAERAIASERSEIEGAIRQSGSGGGTGVNERSQLALKSRAASQAALQRATVYTEAGAQKAAVTAQVNLYLNEFGKRMAEDSVNLAQEWVNGTAGVRDQYQAALDQIDFIQSEMANEWAQIFFADFQRQREQSKLAKSARREAIFGFATGSIAVATIFGGGQPKLGNATSGIDQPASGSIGGGMDTGVGTPMDTGGGGGGGFGSSLGAFASLL
jgi:hypothetical protein